MDNTEDKVEYTVDDVKEKTEEGLFGVYSKNVTDKSKDFKVLLILIIAVVLMTLAIIYQNKMIVSGM